MKNLLPTLLICVFSTGQAISQPVLTPERFLFEDNIALNESIPSPESVLGYAPGEAFTIYHQVIDYFQKLDESSERLILGRYGETYEGRPLIYAIITSENNHAQLEFIRKRNLQLTDPLNIPPAKADSIMEDQPVVVSFSYNIHGNEPSSTEAAMQVAYRLTAAQDNATQKMLDSVVLIMYPCINPDGRDRYVYWYRSMRRNVLATEPVELEHDAPWPLGRTNHYWFDLNRDWVWGVHPESRGHVSIYQQWMPQVHVDYHEQGYNSNYFTAPGTTPRNKLLPDRYEAWSDTFGKANIAAFNEYKIAYFTSEAFDFFYPGYGSSYPSVMGAIGMLTEQGGIGAGRAIQTDDGYILTLRQRIFDHYLTSMATLRKAAHRRRELLSYTHEALNPRQSKSQIQTYIFPDDRRGYLYEVLGILLNHGVKIERATQSFTLSDAKDYQTGNASVRSFPEGTYMISANQSRHLFIQTVLSRQMEIEDSVMYDMSTWSAPLAYTLEAYYSSQVPGISTEPITQAPSYPIGVINPEASYAYVIDWNQRYSPKALSMLWDKGYQVRAARKAFQTDSMRFHPGTLIILLGRNYDKLGSIKEDVEDIARTARVNIHGLNTGRMQAGIDLVSRDSRPVKRPRVALMVDEPFPMYTAGQVYFLFDQETALPVSRIRTSQLTETAVPKFGSRYGLARLTDYDVIILPGGNQLDKVFDESGIQQLKGWVSQGGTLVALTDAVDFMANNQSGITDLTIEDAPKDSSDRAKYLQYKDQERFRGLQSIPGAALNAVIDNSHPLAFGLEKNLYTIKSGTTGIIPSTTWETVGYYVKDSSALLVAGYASKKNLEYLAGKSFVGVVNQGRGKIVLIADNVHYRMFWRGGSRMIQNAVMLLPGM